MKLEVIDYQDLINSSCQEAHQLLERALLTDGIVGVRHVPGFVEASNAYVNAARTFGRLADNIKKQYIPNRDAGEVEGYELGAEKFKNEKGEWVTDDKKASYYAMIPDQSINIWPQEVDLRTPYLALGSLIFDTCKHVLNVIGLNENVGIHAGNIEGHGRMLHYQSVREEGEVASAWCGAHFDHSILTGLMPAYYFHDDVAVSEPEEAGLYIIPHHGTQYEKVSLTDQSIMLFQAGEFGQIISNDRIHATKHLVRKTPVGFERFTFALFVNIDHDYQVKPVTALASDPRFQKMVKADGSITYGDWRSASYDRYRV